MNKIKTLLIGSGEFAIPIFKEALQLDFLNIVGMVTQPDKPFGRKKEMRGSPLFEDLKGKNSIRWFKPVRFRNEYKEILAESKPDLVIVASYGQILPKEFIEYPKYKSLNFHGSLLPELRGAVPVQMAILQGLAKSGVTLQLMSEGMDEGAIISTREVHLDLEENTKSLMSKLSTLSINILLEDLENYLVNKITPIEQDHLSATYCYKSDITREKAEINYETDFELAERMGRAFYPEPCAWVKLENGKILKIFKSKLSPDKKPAPQLITKESKSLFLNLKNGVLELIEIQLEGKERRGVKDYLYLAT